MANMKEQFKTLLIALVIAIVMVGCALIKQYQAYGDEILAGMFSPIGFLVWGGSFCITAIFFYVAIDSIKKWNKRKK